MLDHAMAGTRDVRRCQRLEPEFLQHGNHWQQSTVNGKILTGEIIRRANLDFIGLGRSLLRALFDGRLLAMLSSVRNNLATSLGPVCGTAIFADSLPYPMFRVPKWLSALRPSRGARAASRSRYTQPSFVQ